ncbi:MULTISPECIES: endolytic transglycosylase MltG [Bifidobacterium]|uniref:Endolytic murein transglycosylase n=1 Tax=Bifidobacterium asteroides TaxID=1684 RepID=A0A556RCF9_9BIFI|nr:MULTISPECIES: endolytic transglycosylase MltG [Bifidobacterium]TSJ86570.1 endolytic transglycosylase MltG [Bifidobacterium polysaccharolyticum]
MADDMQEFFQNKVQWVTDGQAPVSAMPPRPPHSRREMRRRRERRKHRKQIMIVIIALAVVLATSCVVILVGGLRHGAPRIVATKEVAPDYPGPGGQPLEFTVESGQGADQVGANLVKAGVVKSTAAFLHAITSTQSESRLLPGVFDLRLRMKASDVVAILTDSSKAGGFLQVRAGERIRDVVARAAQLSGVPQSEFDALIQAKGEGILPQEAQGNFEGWLQPGEYDVRKAGSAKAILSNLVSKRVEHLDQLGVPGGQDRQTILNTASITEAEVNKSEYYSKVARVIENRLAKGMPLGMDSTVAYSNNVSALKLTDAMLKNADDPYNTRVHPGLPPGPIGSPGDEAIQAVMHPESGDWLYFVTVNMDTGETRFSDNPDQFNRDVKEYKAWESQHSQQGE